MYEYDDAYEASPPLGSAPWLPYMAASSTSSRFVTKMVSGSHYFVIQSHSLAKGMGFGKHITSETFIVGRYRWAIYFYPNGKNPEDSSTLYVSVLIALAFMCTDVCTLCEFTLQDQSGEGKNKVQSQFDQSLESGSTPSIPWLHVIGKAWNTRFTTS